MPVPPIETFKVGWLCALTEEYFAAIRMLDSRFDEVDFGNANDDTTYTFGRIGKHNVVMGCPPMGRTGLAPAMAVAKDMQRSFPHLRFVLMVGIGGGSPFAGHDIRLGDVVVTAPKRELGGLHQYDRGKTLSDGDFPVTGQLDGPLFELLSALREMNKQQKDITKPDSIAEHMKLLDDMPTYRKPPVDHLYRSDFEHRGNPGTCEVCDPTALVERLSRKNTRQFEVHYRVIASATAAMSDPESNVMYFATEAAGLMKQHL
ncbi:hypothetical protein IQ07DRAFT_611212 [Pyrenochaeta sp. DS3sAY3a]|nr:hypothetical protein IQ07DRAFT_611212 [Pyrenochaeta sp. DS3sAY3a]